MLKKPRQFIIVLSFITTLVIGGCAPLGVTPLTPQPSFTPELSRATSTPIMVPTPNGPEFGVDPADLNELQIEFLHPWTGGVLDELTGMVDEFNQTNEWGIHVIMSAPGSAAMVTGKTREGIANKQPPNVLAAPSSFLLAVDKKEGLVVDLAPYIESQAYGLTEEVVIDFTPYFWNALMVDGKRVGIPAQESAVLLAYNTTWAKELGLNGLPDTPEKFRTQMCSANASFLKDADTTNDGLGGLLVNNDPVAIYSWLMAYGLGFNLNPDEGYVFSGEAGEAAFNFLLDLKSDSCAWVGRPSQDFAYFGNRQALAIAIWLQDLPTLARELERTGSEDEWTVIPFPGSADQVAATGGTAFAVLQNDPAQDMAAWLFVRWLSQPAQQLRLLEYFGTLPVSETGEQAIIELAATPQLITALKYKDLWLHQPVDADWMAISLVLEDAGWQLLKTEITPEMVPSLLQEMDALAEDLVERNP